MSNQGLFDKSNSLFNAAISEGGTPNQRVLWNDPNKQLFRFSEILHFFESKNVSVLDIGCGNGELLNFLNYNGFTGTYTGVDIHAGLIEEAVARFPKQDFRCLDFFKTELGIYDYVVMSGVFNANFGQDQAFVRHFIERMYQLCSERTIFNAISTHVSFRDPSMYYISPTELVESLILLTPKVELRHGVLPCNFTVCLHKGKDWTSIFTQTAR